MNYMIIDEDKNNRTIIRLLLQQHHLGNLAVQMENGENAIEEILLYRPDVLLIDPDLSDADGGKIIREVTARGYKGKIIVMSGVTEEAVVSQAYESGILFYISKPVNETEVVSILKSTKKMVELEQSLGRIRSIVFQTEQELETVKMVHQDIDERLYEIFTEIGIVGLSGTDEIGEVLKSIYRIQQSDQRKKYHLKDIYHEVCIRMHGESNLVIDQKNMEQRIRRTIQKALGNIAEMGCEDYYDSIFTRYANVLFDFKQVRQEMQHIKDPQAYAGKINTKKFMEGILSRVD